MTTCASRYLFLFSLSLSLLASRVSADSAGEVNREVFEQALRQVELEKATLLEQLKHRSDEERRDAVRRWDEKNANRLDAQMKLAEELFPAAVEDQIITIDIPNEATAKEVALLTERANFENEADEVASRYVGLEQQRDALRLWAEKNQARLDRQKKLWDEIRAEAPAPAPLQAEAPRAVPADATPELRAFMQEEAAMADARREVRDAARAAGIEAERDAVRQWDERSAARLRAHANAARKLVPSK